MNKFRKLTDKLLKNKLWRSSVKVIQLTQTKSENGRNVYIDSNELNTYGVIKTIKVYDQTSGLFKTFTSVVISSKDLTEFDFSNKFAI